MKNLCVDVRMLNASGIGTYLQNLLPGFDQHYQLLLLGNEKEISVLNLKNAEIIHASASIYSIKEQYEIPLKVPSCDLFWSPHYNIPLLPVKAKKRIVTIHDVFHLNFFNTLSLSQKIYSKFFFKSAAKISDQIITVSHFSKKELIKYFPFSEKKINVIHNGVSKEFQSINNAVEKNAFKIRYSLPDNFILFVGNVKPHKNILNLIKAFGSLKADSFFHDYKLVIAGKRRGLITGSEELDQLIKNSNLGSEVIFLEHIESTEMPVLYNLASLLVLPSFYEGFGLPPLEAMACGCATIISDIECLKEIYGNESLYVSPFQVESIKKGIQTILKDELLRKNLIERGKEHVKKFRWETSVNQHLHIFEKTLQKK